MRTHLAQPLPAFSSQIYPKTLAPVLIRQEGQSFLVAKNWGIPMQIQGKTKKLERHVTNARNDKLGGYPPDQPQLF